MILITFDRFIPWQSQASFQTTCEANIAKIKLCLNFVHINFVTVMKRIGQMKGVFKAWK